MFHLIAECVSAFLQHKTRNSWEFYIIGFVCNIWIWLKADSSVVTALKTAR